VRLPAEAVARGEQLLVFTTIDSTMDEARRQHAAGVHSPLWIVADEQEAGRGRQGRIWASPAGNLHVTLLLPAPCALRDQAKLGFAAGVALALAIGRLLPTDAEIKLKWPNDVLVNGSKVSGLLLEGLGQGAAVAIGMGVNIVACPPDTPYAAGHLRQFAPKMASELLLAALVETMTDQLTSFADGSGFPIIRQRWLARAAHLGRSISVRQGDILSEGIFRDIDADGRLILESSGALARIDAGDVFPLDN
jgi:BirA family transcriptional regulator, biotin operon repressor / biotin---[acetyl-CoA-carboxylase] ligase